jgi:hypothetical protein
LTAGRRIKIRSNLDGVFRSVQTASVSLHGRFLSEEAESQSATGFREPHSRKKKSTARTGVGGFGTLGEGFLKTPTRIKRKVSTGQQFHTGSPVKHS